MGMTFRPRGGGRSLDVWVGPDIPDGIGARFAGKGMRGPNGAKNYTHLNFVRGGNEYVSRSGGDSIWRARGAHGEKFMERVAGGNTASPELRAVLNSASAANRSVADMSRAMKMGGRDLASQVARARDIQAVSQRMLQQASKAGAHSGRAARALSQWKAASGTAEGLARVAASANESAIRLAAKAGEASAKAAAAQAELDAKAAAAAAEFTSKQAARAAEEAAKQAARTAETLAKAAARAAETAAKAAAAATEATLRATAAATEAAVRAAIYTAAAALSAVAGG